ncbi:type II secretion system protein GspJ [Rhodanobacter sp. Root480]|uniref:Type II secretion system protein J n=1 Tax=Rhodanobacter ginsenosidimutans TaxID=490571 RepID=A0ABW0JW00_9GAMM|nr:type II secretion system protein GspJ [Rhodanobacter sp. Root480]KQX99027.1 type II secretion system protein GspJ [Rhodanobacter sp. Root480]
MTVDEARGFTLIELLAALLVLSLLSLMAYRGLGVVVASRNHIETESTRWRQTVSFFTRFEGDLRLAAPRPVRNASGTMPAWLGRGDAVRAPLVEFSRFAGTDGIDTPHRVGYGINDTHQVELWIWPGLDLAGAAPPARYVVLRGVRRFDLQYMGPALAWSRSWPTVSSDPALPRAVRLRIEFDSGETVVRVFALRT